VTGVAVVYLLVYRRELVDGFPCGHARMLTPRKKRQRGATLILG